VGVARRERPVRFWLLGLAGAVLGAIVIGVVVYQLARPRGAAAASDEGWGELGAVVEGLAAGVLAGVIAWLVLLLLYLRRYLAPTSRLAAGGASLGGVLVGALTLAALGAALAGVGGAAGGSWATLGALQGACLAAAALPPVVVSRIRRRDGS
jgi:uncharacterized BrkB/YihY/UPF0761 family membrane protein